MLKSFIMKKFCETRQRYNSSTSMYFIWNINCKGEKNSIFTDTCSYPLRLISVSYLFLNWNIIAVLDWSSTEVLTCSFLSGGFFGKNIWKMTSKKLKPGEASYREAFSIVKRSLQSLPGKHLNPAIRFSDLVETERLTWTLIMWGWWLEAKSLFL